MIISLREWMRKIIFIFIFTLLLVVVAGGYRVLKEWVEPFQTNERKIDNAVKVFYAEAKDFEQQSVSERLLWFYWIGE